jgi:hypothetical protein
MKLASFKISNSSTWGVIEKEEAIDVCAPSLWLKPSDIVEVEIDRISVLRNGVADET